MSETRNTSDLTEGGAQDADAAGVDSVQVVTMGCRLNGYESAAAKGLAAAAGAQNTVIINTCAVTNEAVRQARQTVRKTRKANPDAQIVVTGCAAQIDPDMFASMAEVDVVLGNQEKLSPQGWARVTDPARTERVIVNDIMSVTETAGHLLDVVAGGVDVPGAFEGAGSQASATLAAQIGDQSGRARAYVQVQNGCDHRCTFCIIPFGRGNSRSVPAGVVVEEIRALVAAGHQEIVLTGVDITSWGGDLPGEPSLGSLVRRILRGVPDLYRLRLSSLDAVEIDDDLFRFVVEEERVAPHLHLSLQAGDDMILKRMKRRHSRDEAIALCRRLRAERPDIAFGADIIAGFPTETEAMFENSLRLVDECGLAYLHVFPYSARPGTPAARMPQLAGDVVKDRAARLREKGAQALSRHFDRHVGRMGEVLMERGQGRLADFSPVRLDAGAARPGAVVRARITGHDEKTLLGEGVGI